MWSQSDHKSLPASLIETLRQCDEDLFENLNTLLCIGCVALIGSCEAERSFSCIRRGMTVLRSTMTYEHLSGLAMMAVHHKVTRSLDTADNVKRFVQLYPRRLFCKSILFDDV